MERPRYKRHRQTELERHLEKERATWQGRERNREDRETQTDTGIQR